MLSFVKEACNDFIQFCCFLLFPFPIYRYYDFVIIPLGKLWDSPGSACLPTLPHFLISMTGSDLFVWELLSSLALSWSLMSKSSASKTPVCLSNRIHWHTSYCKTKDCNISSVTAVVKIIVYGCVYVCVCVCVFARENEKKRKSTMKLDIKVWFCLTLFSM